MTSPSSQSDRYEMVAKSVLILPGDGGALCIGWWAPEGSDWRPARRPQASDELHIHLPHGGS